jgi:protein-disulfide isomerase
MATQIFGPQPRGHQLRLELTAVIDTEYWMHKAYLIGFATILFGMTPTAATTTTAEDIVALVDGKPILDKDLEERSASQLRALNAKIFEVKEQALNEMIDEQLLNREARRLKLSVQQLLRREVDSQVSQPTSTDVESYYSGMKERIGRPLEEVRPQIVELLAATRRRTAYEGYLGRLRSREKIVVLLAPPRVKVSADTARVRGPANAPITIVEFSDFECSYCGRVNDTLRRLISRYPTEIRLAYRDFPLDFHLHARAAAEASRCASAQGKYWPYHNLLFENQQHLESSDLTKFAVRLDLDPTKFDECIARKTYAADIQRDLDEGQKLGVTETPAFFVNGMLLSGAVPLEQFTSVVERELERQHAANPALNVQPSDAGPHGSVNACAFLEDSEVAAILARKMSPGDRRDSGEVSSGDYATPGTYSSTCVWRVMVQSSRPEDSAPSRSGGSYVILNVMRWPTGRGEAAKFLQSFRDAARDGTIDRVPVPLAIADGGLWWGDGVAAYKGDRSFGISVHLIGSSDRERDMEEALARKIATRL